MRNLKARYSRLWLVSVSAVAILCAGCSKGGAETTTSNSTSTTLQPAGPIGGWSAVQLPNPPGATDALLTGVSCSSVASCTAVGAYAKTGKFYSLVERWNGSSWSAEPLPGAAASVVSRLLAISCPSTTACFAVGEITTATSSEAPLVERWNGATWSALAVPLPKKSSASELTSISCSSPVACTAVGTYRVPPLGQTVVLVERWNGLRWVLQVAPALPEHVTSVTLLQVSCSRANACTAVGQSTTSSGSTAVADYWDGTAWATQALPVLAGRRSAKLSGVSCVSPADCTAVGDATATAGSDASLAEHWDGRKWVLESVPGLANRELVLSAITCESSSACTAVGRETIALYGPTGWKVQPAPVPTSAVVSNLSGPSAVACTSTGACKGVGVSIALAGTATMLVVTNS